jgi:capsular exopolysaccharide synthesis family protein
MSQQLITLTDPDSPAAEAYRTLRTNISFCSVDEPLRTLLLTCASPDERSSITAANLAVAMADGDQKVVLVDADLRKPELHLLFGLGNERGFTDMFRDEQALAEPPLQPVAGTSLQVLTSGVLPPVPSHILLSKKMAEVIKRLKEMADIVLFDAPPLIAVSDASLLASRLDGVLLVVQANNSKRDHVRETKARLEKVNARLIGAVLTNAPMDVELERYYAGH